MLRSVAFNLFYVLWTIFLGILFLPLLVSGSKRGIYRLGRFWCNTLLLAVRCLCGVRSEAQGQEHIVAGPVIYAAKHQSAWDILMLTVLLPQPSFVLKKELLSIPFFGWYLRRLNMVAIDRSKGVSALKHIQSQALKALHSHQPLVIFPEGTRTVPGAETRYHTGVAALYQALKVPVVPVAIASGQCWGRNAFHKTPGRAVVRFLPPIAPGLPPKEFMALLQQTIEPASAKLLAEATQA